MRNPVVDMSALRAVSDIPDWACVEGGITFDPATPSSDVEIGKLYSMSPIALVKNVS